VRAIYGVPMTAGATPAAAAQGWLSQHADAFGAGEVELDAAFSSTIMSGRFTAFGYTQSIDGMPVEYGNARILVLNATNEVVYAAGTLAPRPEGGFDPVLVTPEDALLLAQGQLGGAFLGLESWTEPELTVWQGESPWIEPVLTWKVSGGAADVSQNPLGQTWFIDASTGEILHARNEIYTIDIDGSATGLGSSGTLPDIPSNPEIVYPMPNLVVGVDGAGAEGVSDVDGLFTR